VKHVKLLFAATLSSAIFAFAPALPASAHANLESSSPSPSATLELSPQDIVLVFSEPVSRVDGSIELFDQRRETVVIPEPIATASNRIEVRDLPRLDPGLYLVAWRALSEDGHIAQGAFTFQVGSASPTVTAQDLLDGFSESEPMARGIGVVRHLARSVTYLGLAAALGTLAISAAIGVRRWRVVIMGASIAVIGSVVQYAAQSLYVSGRGWFEVMDGTSLLDVLSTRLGQGIAARVGLLVVLVVLVLVARRRARSEAEVRAQSQELGTPATAGARTSITERPWWRSSAALVGGGILLTFSATGHPSASSPASIAAAVDFVHLGAIVLWLGGLIGMIAGEDRAFVRAHSRSATIAIPLAIVTGVWQTWHLLDDGGDITGSEWGRALLVKVAVVLVVLTLALVARWIVVADTTAPLRRLVSVEIVVALVIVGSTSVMVSSPPQVAAAPEVLSVALAQDEIIANVTVTPGRVGPNDLHVTIVTPGGTLDPVDGLDIRITDSSGEFPPVTVDVEDLGPNHFVGTVAILENGPWTLELLVQMSPARVVRLSTTFEL
jgi:copper transport protein